MRKINCTYVEERSRSGGQWRVEDVRMSHDPANVRGTEEDVVIADVPEAGHMVVNSDHVSGVNMHHALWFARGPAGVEDVERIFSFHDFRWTFGRLLAHELVEIDLMELKVSGRLGTAQDHNFVDRLQASDCLPDNRAKFNAFAAAIADVGGEYAPGLAVTTTAAHGLHPEACVDHR